MGDGICQSTAEEQILAYKARQNQLLSSPSMMSQEACLPSLLKDVKGMLIDMAHGRPQLLVLVLTCCALQCTVHTTVTPG